MDQRTLLIILWMCAGTLVRDVCSLTEDDCWHGTYLDPATEDCENCEPLKIRPKEYEKYCSYLEVQLLPTIPAVTESYVTSGTLTPIPTTAPPDVNKLNIPMIIFITALAIALLLLLVICVVFRKKLHEKICPAVEGNQDESVPAGDTKAVASGEELQSLVSPSEYVPNPDSTNDPQEHVVIDIPENSFAQFANGMAPIASVETNTVGSSKHLRHNSDEDKNPAAKHSVISPKSPKVTETQVGAQPFQDPVYQQPETTSEEDLSSPTPEHTQPVSTELSLEDTHVKQPCGEEESSRASGISRPQQETGCDREFESLETGKGPAPLNGATASRTYGSPNRSNISSVPNSASRGWVRREVSTPLGSSVPNGIITSPASAVPSPVARSSTDNTAADSLSLPTYASVGHKNIGLDQPVPGIYQEPVKYEKPSLKAEPSLSLSLSLPSSRDTNLTDSFGRGGRTNSNSDETYLKTSNKG